MAFIAVPDGCRAVIRNALGSEEWSIRLHFTKSSFVKADMEDLADRLDTQWAGVWKARMDTNANYIGVTCYDVRTSTGEVVQNTDNAGAGGAAGDSLPLNVACVVTLRTASRGRSARGRVYMSGFLETDVTDGVFTAAAQTAAYNQINNIKTNAALGGWTLVIASFQLDGVVQDPANTYPVTSMEVRNGVAATQRRRVDRP